MLTHFIIFHFFPWCLNERQFWFWIFLLYHFIKQKPLVSEECGDDDTFCIQFASIHETTSQAESNSRERELPKKPWELIHDWDVWVGFHPFSGWVFFHKAAYKKVQGMPTCLGCVASEILDVDICTKSAKAMSSHKQDRNLWICVVFLQLNCKAIRLFLLNRVCSTWFIKIP